MRDGLPDRGQALPDSGNRQQARVDGEADDRDSPPTVAGPVEAGDEIAKGEGSGISNVFHGCWGEVRIGVCTKR